MQGENSALPGQTYLGVQGSWVLYPMIWATFFQSLKLRLDLIG